MAYIPRPKSFLKLILLAFALVTLPLLVALAFAAVYMDRMADQSQLAVYQAARATKSSRILVEQVNVMERAARQYLVLGDKALLKAYQESHEKLQVTIASLLKLSLDQTLREKLIVLSEREHGLLGILSKNPFNSDKNKDAVGDFEAIAKISREVLSGSQGIIDREVQVMYDIASNAQTLFFWFGLTLIPAVIVVVVGFTITIARPIRQIDQAIRKLGDGKFNAPIKVAGPQDLEQLGQRLNWLRQRLAEVEQEKIKFLRHVSHELKTPLTALREGTDLLADGVVGVLNTEQQEVVSILGSNTAQLQSLIEDLLNFSVMHLKHPQLLQEIVDLDIVMQRVIADQKLAIMAKQLELSVDIQSVRVLGDKEKLRVVFDNLLSNAVKYSPRRGVIDITINKSEEEARVDVQDAGPGIQAWEMERVFEAFYQGEAVADGHIKGTGLGLSITRDYVQAHGGYISVDDKPTKGAHLSLRLPLFVEE